MNEKDMLQKIKEDAQQVTPPSSLAPDAVEQMLRERAKQEKYQGEQPEHEYPEPVLFDKKKRRYRALTRYGSIAAVFVFAMAAMWQSQRISKRSEHDAAPKDTVIFQTEENTVKKAGQTGHVQSEDSTQTERTPDVEKPKTQFKESFTYASDPQAIYTALYEQFRQNSMDADGYGSISSKGTNLIRGEIVEDSAPMQMEMARSATMDTADTGGSGESGADFSTTNLQELSVDEGDIVKTDGQYIYILRRDLSLSILKADKKEPQFISTTYLGSQTEGAIQEMYLDAEKETLYIILSEYITSLENNENIYYTSANRQAKLLTYDIADRKTPVLTGTVTQDGFYETSRKNGPYIYLFTSYHPDIQDTYENSTIMPRINGTEAAAGDVFLPENLSDSAYLVISSVNTAQPDAIADSKILVSGASNYYVSAENIYITNTKYDSGQPHTQITKFHYSDGQIVGVAAGSVKGYLNNSFSLNEYNGNLRVVSTYTGDDANAVRDFASNITGQYYEQNWTEHNALYVLDEQLKQIGKIEGLADNETIRSARFFGDIGYFVTFRQTDPLFSVDLSDPANPQILGELKVSGFSSYLHFYGENHLLGIGYEADEATGMITGLKLSMFDISDPKQVTEVNSFTIPGITWCPAIENYKSILVQPEKNLIGFYCDNRYLLFSYDEEKGFVQEMVYDFYSDMLTGQAEYDTMRGLYIEDAFYLAGNTFLISFDMEKDFEKTGVLQF